MSPVTSGLPVPTGQGSETCLCPTAPFLLGLGIEQMPRHTYLTPRNPQSGKQGLLQSWKFSESAKGKRLSLPPQSMDTETLYLQMNACSLLSHSEQERGPSKCTPTVVGMHGVWNSAAEHRADIFWKTPLQMSWLLKCWNAFLGTGKLWLLPKCPCVAWLPHPFPGLPLDTQSSLWSGN